MFKFEIQNNDYLKSENTHTNVRTGNIKFKEFTNIIIGSFIWDLEVEEQNIVLTLSTQNGEI